MLKSPDWSHCFSTITLGTSLLGLSFSSADAAILNASTGNLADVGKAVASAKAGDLVQIPPGTYTWTSPLWVTNGITVQGAGMDKTVIVDEVPRSLQRHQVFLLSATAIQSVRLTGLTIRGGTTNTTLNYDGEILAGGNTRALRIDHVRFDADHASGIEVNGPVGVIDHCLFTSAGVQGVIVFHSGWNGASYGDGSWADADLLGTDSAMYIEDNTFVNNNFAGAFDSCKGGRLVFRYNTVTNSFVGNHGTDTTQRYRSARTYEIYGNSFYWDSSAPNAPWPFAVYLRGGTGVIFSNTFDGAFKNGGITVANYRSTTNPEGYPWKPWGPVENASLGVDGPNVWDGNTDTNGYPALDQVGRGRGDLVKGDVPVNSTTGTPTWPHQIQSPLYQWGNTINGAPARVGSQTPNIQAGRDWVDYTPRPGYAPYAYPHPLVTGDPKPSAPNNLRIVGGP